jgi:hypothetical protein
VSIENGSDKPHYVVLQDMNLTVHWEDELGYAGTNEIGICDDTVTLRAHQWYGAVGTQLVPPNSKVDALYSACTTVDTLNKVTEQRIVGRSEPRIVKIDGYPLSGGPASLATDDPPDERSGACPTGHPDC